MKKLTKGEASTRAVKIDGRKASVSCTVARNEAEAKDGVRYQLEYVLDFSACSEAEILELATRSAIIAYQAMWRRANDKDKLNATMWERTVDVKADIIDASRERGPVDPVKAAERALAKLASADPEALKALLASLMPKKK